MRTMGFNVCRVAPMRRIGDRMIAFSLLDHLWVVVFGAGRPTDAAWAEWVDYRGAVEQQVGWPAARIIFHEPGWACSEQPRFLHDMIGARVPIAVISADADIRDVVTVMSWFNHRVRGFAPTALVDALGYLGIAADRTAQIDREAENHRHLVRRRSGGMSHAGPESGALP